jgi:uncharacterized protein (DUF2147 family)
MKKLLALAAFVFMSSAAQAQYTFEYGGRSIRIDPDRGTVSIPGVFDNTGHASKHARSAHRAEKSRKQNPEQAKAAPQSPPASGVAPSPAEEAPAPIETQPQVTTAATASNPSLDSSAAVASPAAPSTQGPSEPIAAAPTVSSTAALAAAPSSAPIQTSPLAQQSQPSTAPTTTVRDPNSPVGVWLTEEKEGKVRIEHCGANLCGYAVDSKSNQNGEQVLINMKASKDAKWTGRILDPNTGSTYDSTIALRGPDTLRVQGCAFGGMFCGGQTWTRVN